MGCVMLHCLYLFNFFGFHVADSLTFIDLEYGGPNFRGFDIGDFFCEFAGNFRTFICNSMDSREIWDKYHKYFIKSETIKLQEANPTPFPIQQQEYLCQISLLCL